MAGFVDLSADATFRREVSQYMQAQTLRRSVFVESGAAEFETREDLQGHMFDVRKWSEFSGASEVNDGSTPSTANKISQYVDIGVIKRRKKMFEVAGVLEDAMGSAERGVFMDEIQRQLGNYWPLEFDRLLVSIIGAQFGTSGALASTHLNNIRVTSTSATPALAGIGPLTNTLTKLGDNANYVSMWVFHSLVWADLKMESTTTNNGAAKETFEATPMPGFDASGPRVVRGTYMGRPAIISDSVPTVGSGTRKGFLSLAIAPGQLNLVLQTALKVLGDVDITVPSTKVQTTVSFGCHNRGVKWASSTINPSDADLATAGNWTKVAADKEIRIVGCLSNAANAS